MESYQLEEIYQFALVIIFIIGFVATVMGFKQKENNNRTKVLLSALEKGQDINPELLAPQKNKTSRNKWGLLALLISGCGMTVLGIALIALATVYFCLQPMDRVINGDFFGFIPCFIILAIGIALLIGYFVGKKLLKPEVDKETEEAKK
ncbi:MAG: hypothetical protein KBS77_06875 [Bacteroidales bacterium]|nr:hypothetical protein [Candidatus Colicola faecequi]